METWLDMAGNAATKQAMPLAQPTTLPMITRAARLATNAALFALIPFLLAGKPAISQQTICDEVQNYVNMLVDHTKTTCIPVDASSDTFAF